MGKLQGKTAVITGGSSGMALAAARLFVEEGAYVFITGRRQEQLDEAVRSIGRNVTGVQGDASELPDLDRLYAAVARERGRIDVLLTSAGAGGSIPLGSATEVDFDRFFNTNCRSAFFAVQKALPLLRDGGSILLNSSATARKGVAGRSLYAGSKAALLAFARCWLVELKDRRIRVNVLSPGPIETPPWQGMPAEAREAYRASIPRGELGRPAEFASAALFLASEDASFINGVDLAVDGGTYQI